MILFRGCRTQKNIFCKLIESLKRQIVNFKCSSERVKPNHCYNFRDKVGPRFGLYATTATFMASQSQIQAKRAGFEEQLSIYYSEMIDKNGKLMFPEMPPNSCVKIMTKKWPHFTEERLIR